MARHLFPGKHPSDRRTEVDHPSMETSLSRELANIARIFFILALLLREDVRRMDPLDAPAGRLDDVLRGFDDDRDGTV